jgi:SAM-dependent methyltransferase
MFPGIRSGRLQCMDETLDFSRRAELEEEIDGPCSYEDLRACLRDLAIVNRMTRAHRPILLWLDEVADAISARHPPASQDRDVRRQPHALKIVDVGCGYGDMLRRIERWAAGRGLAVELIGVDINANGARAAREATPPTSRIQWIHGDAMTRPETADADVVTTSGVMHHLAETEIVQLLRWMERTARVGWFVADLHRKPLPYRVFDVIMRGPWWHRFIRPDGLRSLRRSFLEEDWARMCAAAGMGAEDVEIREHRPARLCVGRLKAA